MSTSSTTENSDSNGVASDSAHDLQPSVCLVADTSSAPIVSNGAHRPMRAADPNLKASSIAELSRSNGSVSSNASGSYSNVGSKASVCVSEAEAEAEDSDFRRDVLEAFTISADYNFWTPDAYLQTFVKRLADGKSACEGLASLLAGRAALEKQVAVLYKQWATKANSFVSNTREMGSTRRLLQKLAEQADSVAKAHQRLRSDLRCEFSGPIAVVRSFVKANYTKAVSAIPERFAKAQKDWTRVFRQLDDKKRAYYGAVLELKVADAKRQFAAATKADDAEKEKEEERFARCAERRQVVVREYKQLLRMLANLRHQYTDRMSQVASDANDLEARRGGMMKQAVSLALRAFRHTNVLEGDSLRQLKYFAERAEPKRDVEQFDKLYGSHMEYVMPAFEANDDPYLKPNELRLSESTPPAPAAPAPQLPNQDSTSSETANQQSTSKDSAKQQTKKKKEKEMQTFLPRSPSVAGVAGRKSSGLLTLFTNLSTALQRSTSTPTVVPSSPSLQKSSPQPTPVPLIQRAEITSPPAINNSTLPLRCGLKVQLEEQLVAQTRNPNAVRSADDTYPMLLALFAARNSARMTRQSEMTAEVSKPPLNAEPKGQVVAPLTAVPNLQSQPAAPNESRQGSATASEEPVPTAATEVIVAAQSSSTREAEADMTQRPSEEEEELSRQRRHSALEARGTQQLEMVEDGDEEELVEAVARHAFSPEASDAGTSQLGLEVDEELHLVSGSEMNGWVRVYNKRVPQAEGWVPAAYLQVLD